MMGILTPEKMDYNEIHKLKEKIKELEKSLFHCCAKPSGKISSLTHDDLELRHQKLINEQASKILELEAELKEANKTVTDTACLTGDMIRELNSKIRYRNDVIRELKKKLPSKKHAELIKTVLEMKDDEIGLTKEEKELLKRCETWLK